MNNVSYQANSNGDNRLTQQQQIIKEQDDALMEIGMGVGRLQTQSKMINEEAQMHVRLLEEMDYDVDKAAIGLKQEARHAEKIREQTKLCYLYMCIIILFVILILLQFSSFGLQNPE